MRAERIEARGFRNLADLDLTLPAAGAVFLGPNGQGKTSLLELLYYAVLFRSFRGAADADVVQWDASGFFLALVARSGPSIHECSAGYLVAGKRKRITVDGVEPERLGEAIGHWLAVAFLPTDLHLVQGPASGRRQYLDRVLSLADGQYFRSLTRYRAALQQRNAALRQNRGEVARMFDGALGRHGAALMARRLAWVEAARERYDQESKALGEAAQATMRYRGNPDLVEAEAWPAALLASAGRDQARRATMVGPHRDDLELDLGGKPLREFGSRGQHRTAATALKLCERATLAAARSAEPALLLDDVFAELDRPRQERLSQRLVAPDIAQVFVTAPRRDELPPTFALDVFEVRAGRVEPAGALR